MTTTGDTPNLHHDPLTTRTVFVAPGRARRPRELEGETVRCPFCAGNESLTPAHVLRTPSSPAQPWRARIVPNQFPIVAHEAADGIAGAHRIGRPRPAVGVHEVVIESSSHVRSILAIDPADWRSVWELCRERLEMLAQREDLAWATIFKNAGRLAGASLEHVHSQLVAIDFIPPVIQAELIAAGNSNDPFDELVRRSEIEGRLVERHGDLVALVPPAPRQPFETWILPRTAEPFLHTAAETDVASLAALTQSLIGRIDGLVPGFDYNWWLHQAPFDRRPAERPALSAPSCWRWHLEIMPRVNGLAGFELGAGCHITTVPPQDCARLLRNG